MAEELCITCGIWPGYFGMRLKYSRAIEVLTLMLPAIAIDMLAQISVLGKMKLRECVPTLRRTRRMASALYLQSGQRSRLCVF